MNRNIFMALAGCVFIAGATFIAYSPAIKGEFLWDDFKYVVDNPLLSAPDGLWKIWFSTDVPSQYFPLVYTTFRFEKQLWGLNPIPCHIDNIALHVISALLVWLILRRLSIPGAFVAAAAFALHPLNVESVAWITQRKNTLMLVFALLSILFYIEFALRNRSGLKAGVFYALSLVSFILSLFSKTTACVAPPILILILWLKHVPLNFKRILEVVPYFVLGLAMGFLTMWWEHTRQGVSLLGLGLTFTDKVLIASRALWFYAGKIVWPVNLAFSYPRWEIEPASAGQYVWLAGCVLVGAGLFVFRRRIGRGATAAIVFYVIALFPMLGFFQLYTFIYTWVADHYAYMATIGLIALIVGFGRWVLSRNAAVPAAAKQCIGGVVLIILGVLTYRQAGLYARPEAIWHDTLKKNPESWLAHNNLGQILLIQNKPDEAIVHIKRSLELAKKTPAEHKHDIVSAHFNLGLVYRDQKKYEESIEQFREAVKIDPNDVGAHFELADTLEKAGRLDESADEFGKVIEIGPDAAIVHYRLAVVLEGLGNIVGAIRQCQKALDIEPDYLDALQKLVNINATRQDYEIMLEAKASEYAKRAVEKTGGKNPIYLNLLGMAYASERKYGEAITAAQKAYEIASAAGAKELTNVIEKQIESYGKLLEEK